MWRARPRRGGLIGELSRYRSLANDLLDGGAEPIEGGGAENANTPRRGMLGPLAGAAGSAEPRS